MKFAFDKQDSYTIFSIQEDKLNSLNAPHVKAEFAVLHNEGTRNIILNIDGISFVDSSGLSAILVGKRLCDTVGGTFVITGNQRQCDALAQNLATRHRATPHPHRCRIARLCDDGRTDASHQQR